MKPIASAQTTTGNVVNRQDTESDVFIFLMVMMVLRFKGCPSNSEMMKRKSAMIDNQGDILYFPMSMIEKA
jgi:hypothetical protein